MSDQVPAQDGKEEKEHITAERQTPNLTREPGLRSALKLFLLVFILLLVVGSAAQAWHFEYGMIFTQLFIVLLPALIYWRRFNIKGPEFSRLTTFSVRYLPAVVVLAISFWLINMVFATGLVLSLMEFGFEPIVAIEPPRIFQEYLGYLVVLAIFAGICEEVLFRGTIMPSMEKGGIVPAILFSSLLFAMLHGSLLNLVSTFTLGVVMAVVVIKSGSLWGGIIYHMLNNFIAATYLYIAGQAETAAATEVSIQELPAFIPLLILGLVGAWFGLKMLHRQYGGKALLAGRIGWLPRGWVYWPFWAGLFLYLVMVFFELAVGFRWIDLAGF